MKHSHLKILKDLYEFRSNQEVLLQQATKLLSRLSGNAAIGFLPHGDVYHSGLSKIFSQPEFTENPERVVPIASLFDELDYFMNCVMGCCEEQLKILIGEDIPDKRTKNLSLIMKKFSSGDEFGAIGVLGPARMPYPKLIPILDEVAKLLEGKNL